MKLIMVLVTVAAGFLALNGLPDMTKSGRQLSVSDVSRPSASVMAADCGKAGFGTAASFVIDCGPCPEKGEISVRVSVATRPAFQVGPYSKIVGRAVCDPGSETPLCDATWTITNPPPPYYAFNECKGPTARGNLKCYVDPSGIIRPEDAWTVICGPRGGGP